MQEAWGTRSSVNNAAEKDAQTELSKEECALGMGRMSNDAASKDAQIRPRKEECALGMEERDYAAKKDVQFKLRKEECALGMGRRRIMLYRRERQEGATTIRRRQRR